MIIIRTGNLIVLPGLTVKMWGAEELNDKCQKCYKMTKMRVCLKTSNVCSLFFLWKWGDFKYGHDHHHVRQEMSNQIFKWSIKNHEIKKIIMLVGAGATNIWKMLFWRKNKRPKFWSWDYVMRSWLPFLCIFCVVEEEGGSHAPNLASSHLPKYLQCHQYIWQRPPSFPFKYAAITYECCCYLSIMISGD